MKNSEFMYWVGALGGYLSAVSHLNDCADERHGFFASEIDLSNSEIDTAVKSRLNCEDVNLEKIESYSESIRLFASMIKNNIFRNFLLGEKLSDKNKENIIREQLQWHIEDYITMLETSAGFDPESWIVKLPPGMNLESMLFRFKEYSLIVGFSHRKT
ncbi:MAG: hypothetical protein OEZ58_18855 [Gammaproteobacteria bacterium]|nr:hypothetical protein [Gammaproteobacteria bacterium]